MKYYKRNYGEIYEARETEQPVSDICREITEEEYTAAIDKINDRIRNSG